MNENKYNKNCPDWAFDIYIDGYVEEKIAHVLDILKGDSKGIIYNNDMMACVESQLVAEYLGFVKIKESTSLYSG